MPKLVLSPSQQEGNQYYGGGTGYKDSEEFWMRDLAIRVKERFDAQGWGITCVIVNEGSWQANVAKSNTLLATEHLALHTNAGGGHGTELIHYKNLLGVASAKGKAFATALYPFIAAASNMPDRGVKGSSTLGEVKNTKAPAVIVEYLFHDNAAEAEEMRKSLAEFAEATVKGLARHYDKKYHPPVVVTPPAVVAPTPVPVVTTEWIGTQAGDTIVLKKKVTK